MSEHVKEGNKIQLSLNWPGKPEGNAKEVADFIGAKSFGLDGDLNFMHVMDPVLSYRVTNLETYASTLHKNIIQDGQWVELWKEETETDEQLEQERLDKGLGVEAPRITLEHIKSLMQRVEVVTEYSDNPIPHVTAKAFLDGSFFLGTAVSKAVDPANFDKELGFKYSTQDVLKAAEAKLWELEGYALYKSLLELDNYKQANIDKLLSTRIPILDQIYDLCLAIENCGASPELTEAVTKAGALRKPITELVEQAIALGIGQGIVSVSHSNDKSKNI